MKLEKLPKVPVTGGSLIVFQAHRHDIIAAQKGFDELFLKISRKRVKRLLLKISTTKKCTTKNV
jgi:hypothetical protein